MVLICTFSPWQSAGADPAWPGPREEISRNVFPATKINPRNGEGSIIVLQDGSLLFATTEFFVNNDAGNAHIVAKTSTDGGRTWGPARELQKNVGRDNVMSVTLRRLPKHDCRPAPIGMFYLVTNSHSDLKAYLRISSDETKTFGEPILVTPLDGYNVLNNDRVTVLSTGRLLAPVAWSPDYTKINHYISFCFISDDGGRTWRRGKGHITEAKRGAMEPEVIELKDGRVLMIARTQMGHIAASYSSDGGDTWTPSASWNVRAPEAPATLRRIPSTGDLLLVWNDSFVPDADHCGPRTPLTAAVSTDEGKTWKFKRNLESKPSSYCYTSLIFHRGRAIMGYYVDGTSRFRSLPISWFYGDDKITTSKSHK